MSAARGPADIWQNLRRKLATPRATVKVLDRHLPVIQLIIPPAGSAGVCAQDMDPGPVRVGGLLKMLLSLFRCHGCAIGTSIC